MRFLHIICLYLFSLSFVAVQAQSHRNIQFSEIEDLGANSVNSILQDAYGYMWFGSETGLSKYNGYEIVTFSNDPLNAHSLNNNFVNAIIEDTIPGNLWVGTDAGLTYYNSSTEQFSSLNCYNENNVKLNLNKVTSLFWDKDGDLWLVLSNRVICIESKTQSAVYFNQNNSDKIIEGTINEIHYWKDDLYFFLRNDGLYIFNKKDYSLQKVLDDSFHSILQDSKNNFWFGTKKSGIWYLPHNDTEFKKVENTNSNFTGGLVVSIVEDDLNRIWFLVRDKGINIIDAKNNEHTYLSYSVNNRDGIKSNAGQSMYLDAHKNIWVGTSDAGAYFFDNQKKAFTNYQYNYLENGLSNNKIRSMYQDSDGDIWIGTKVDGCLSKFDKDQGTFEHFRQNSNIAISINDDYVFCITEAKPGYLWVGTFRGGLNLFEKKTGKFTHYTHDPNNSNSVSGNSIYTLCKDSEKRLWVGTDFNGLDLFDSAMIKKNYSHSIGDTKSISSDRIRCVYEDRHSNIWVGTINGLNLYNSKTDNFTRYLHREKDATSISNNNISCIYQDSSNRLWVATYGGGLNLMNRKDNTFVNYTEHDGLANNIIIGIVEDTNGDIWLSTLNGVSKFILSNQKTDIPKPNFRNYYENDGLQGQKFNRNAFLKTSEGDILLGGNNGFSIFNPEYIVDNPINAKVNFTDFKLFNKSVQIGTDNSPLNKHINLTKKITLNYNQSIFSINYVAINYSSSQNNQYAFKMEGLEKDWNYVGTRREATYTNLNAGNYVFRVKAANNDGIWSEHDTTIEIKILPHPLLNNWAYLCYALILLAVFWFVRKRTLSRIKIKREREIDQEKLRFFINISHEIRTPLTLILNPINKIKSVAYPESIESSVKSIYQNTNQLLRLVDQLLDYRKSELGKLSLNEARVDVVSFTKNAISLFKEVALNKNIDLSFNSEKEEIFTCLDPNKYERIINNLLSNAIKFSNANDQITVNLSIVPFAIQSRFRFTKKEVPHLKLQVTDTGIGIHKDQIGKIFTRFYSNSEYSSGTGIGLNYTKALVELHYGKVTVESVLNEGSTFAVFLPIHLNCTSKAINKNFIQEEYLFNTSDIESAKYEFSASDNTVETAVESKKSSKQTVLIVEDNKELRKQIKSELTDNYLVVEAINGEDGLHKVESHYPDIIISDVMMPKMNGIQLCDKVKSNIDTSHIPIILLTAKGLVENEIEGLKSGADDYITKPFSMQSLQARIANIIKVRQQLRNKYQSSSAILPAAEITQNNKDQEFLDNATSLLLKNVANHEYTYKELQEELGMSQSSFYRKVKELTNMSPSNFVRNIRIKYAAELLVNNKSSIKEVCYQSGFNSPSHFSRSFRSVFQKSPQDYLQENSAD